MTGKLDGISLVFMGTPEFAVSSLNALSEAGADIVGADDTVDETAPKLVLRVNQAKAALMGVAQADIVEVMRLGLEGESVTPVHGGDNKYEIPVRIQLPPARQSSTRRETWSACCRNWTA